MDFLKAEIANKRKILQDEISTRPSKYTRRGEAGKFKEQAVEKKSTDASGVGSVRLSPVRHFSLELLSLLNLPPSRPLLHRLVLELFLCPDLKRRLTLQPLAM